MIPGWPYSIVAALEPGRTSWTALLDAVRLGQRARLRAARGRRHRGPSRDPVALRHQFIVMARACGRVTRLRVFSAWRRSVKPTP